MAQFTFTGLIVREESAYSALCPELDVASFGDTHEEARAKLLEAVTLHLEGAFEDGLPSLRPVPVAEDPRQLAPETVIETFRFKVDVAVHAHA